jgi:hypothetical protein
VVEIRVQRKNKNMINENDLEKVYVVGQMSRDENGDSLEESDIDHDKRRRVPFYDAIPDPEDLRQVINPIHSETGTTTPADSTITPASSNVQIRSKNTTTGTISYNDVSSRTQNQSGNIAAAKKKTKASKPFDIFFAISTAFLNTLPAISLEDIKFKRSQQSLQFTKLPENLQMPRDPQQVVEYKGWQNTAETFLKRHLNLYQYCSRLWNKLN